MEYRHEVKHEISYSDLLTLRMRLKAVMQYDPHAVDGKYRIRSLYFDDMFDSALRANRDGLNVKEKFRIRLYKNTGYLCLEKKSKLGGLGCKTDAELTREQAQSIIDGNTDWMGQSRELLIRELHDKMKNRLLVPKTIVDYTREPFVYAPGNVRVTFDYDIRTGICCTDFLNPDCIMIPAGDAPILLEVKWDEYLPSVIRDAIQLTGRRSSGFSKYAQCRIYD